MSSLVQNKKELTRVHENTSLLDMPTQTTAATTQLAQDYFLVLQQHSTQQANDTQN